LTDCTCINMQGRKDFLYVAFVDRTGQDRTGRSPSMPRGDPGRYLGR
jgi:hypothetical protein